MEYIPLAKVKKLLEGEEKKRELTNEQKLALAHAQNFSDISDTKVDKLLKELAELDFISELNAIKIVDMLPTHPDDVGAIFAKERFTLEKGQVDSIVEIVGRYI